METKKRYILTDMNENGSFSFLTQTYIKYEGKEIVINDHRKAYMKGDDISELPPHLHGAITALWDDETYGPTEPPAGPMIY